MLPLDIGDHARSPLMSRDVGTKRKRHKLAYGSSDPFRYRMLTYVRLSHQAQPSYTHCQSEERIADDNMSVISVPRRHHRRQQCATAPNVLRTTQPSIVRSVTESLVSFGTTPGELHSVQRSALTVSRPVGKTTAGGYVDFEPPPDGHAVISRRSGFRSKEAAE
jgi:hypothetical protein